ncbi:GEgh16 protein [Xylaria bambusicola]|uniref:GEgh16 protein n=1 Tax=Xylaria bambusicola TaxID=326684 RepID=UPI0020080B2E|nr:GEgh16 protein [Xylaria bambusicola]KAI0505968.1 GEgh16 protein [Xylaria bambusicola]
MQLIKQAFVASSLLAAAHGQAVLKFAKGERGSPFSFGLQVQGKNPNDANFISDVEITTNIVNECGRTLQGGNIDIGENTENALLTGNVTQTTAGGSVRIFMKQVNNLGSGPFTCDMDQTSNSNGVSGQTPLQVKESQPGQNGFIKLSMTMPNDLKCTGASTGNVCTIRCRNANNFGGCIAVQQKDTQPSQNDPNSIQTAQTLSGVLTQVQQNIKDLPFALDGIAGASQDPADQGTSVIEAIQEGDGSTIDNTVQFSP